MTVLGPEPIAVEALARAELQGMGATLCDLPGTMQNLEVAAALGQLHQFYDTEGRHAGFMAWLRMTPERLMGVIARQQRVFTLLDDTPAAAICFIVEQMNTMGFREMQRRMRTLSAIPGVEVLAGWRGGRLRAYMTRAYGFFQR